MTDWQPIATAPRDGTPVLLWAGEWVTARFYYDWEPLETDSDGEGDPYLFREDPTYWMPLPIGPNGETPQPMPPEQPSTPLPPIGEIVAQTLLKRSAKLADDISRNDPLLQRLLERKP